MMGCNEPEPYDLAVVLCWTSGLVEKVWMRERNVFQENTSPAAMTTIPLDNNDTDK